MRSLVLAILLVAVALAAKRNPLKTKKYKCIEVEDDHHEATHYSFNGQKLRNIENVRTHGADTINVPYVTPGPDRTTTVSTMPTKVPRDSHNRPLKLSPDHCKQVGHYATMYGVTDVLAWVKRNCNFAKMYLPDATCEEINILVKSCYDQNYL